MGEIGAAETIAGAPFSLPPRRKTVLARYTRLSKIIVTGFTFTGLVALVYLAGYLYIAQDDEQKSSRHLPKNSSADVQQRFAVSRPTKGAPASASTATTVGMENLNQQNDRSILLAAAPDPNLVENTPQGDLPRVADDGRQPWQVYARPFNAADKRPRLSIIVAGLGLSRTATDAAVTRLPASVTLAFEAQSQTIGAWCGRARQEGHEILLSIPMEPFDFPRSDPGPHTLLTTLSNSENLEKLNWALRQAAGYVGITTLTGSRFLADTDKLKSVMDVLHQRGLLVVDAHITPHSAVGELAQDKHVPVVTAAARIDDNLAPEEIDAAFLQMEQEARLNGYAVGIVAPVPIVIDHLQSWLKTLPDKGIALAPVSAVVQ